MRQRVPVKPAGRPGDEIVRDLPATENRRFYPALDGLRAIAVLLVFFEHYEAYHYPALNWGWMGVDLFFVLSGFLITGILYDTRDARHHFRNFYVRRTLRIFPLYYGVFALALLLTPIFHFRWNGAWLLWVLYLGNYVRFLYLHSPLLAMQMLEHLRAQAPFPRPTLFFVGHFWSLAVEEQFYLIWPLIVFGVRRREHLRTLCVAVIALTLIARVVCVFTVPKAYLDADLLYRVTPLRADALLLGGLVALCLRGPEAAIIRRLANPLLVLLSGSFVVFEGLHRLFSQRHEFYHPRAGAPVLQTIGFTLIDLFAAALILSLLDSAGPLFSLFNFVGLRWLGQISYGFYVFHDIFHLQILHIASGLLHRSHVAQEHLTTLLALAFTITISYLSFRFYETPFLRWKDILSRP